MGYTATHNVRSQLVVRDRSSHAPNATNSRMSSRKKMRSLRNIVLRLQARGAPGAGLEGVFAGALQGACPASTVMDARVAFHPQLHRFRPQTKAAPVRRTRHLLIG